MLLDQYSPNDLYLMFGNDKDAIKKFGDYLVKCDDSLNDSYYDELLIGKNSYENKIDSIKEKGAKNINDMIIKFHQINELNHKIDKNNKSISKKRSKDLSIASYLNDKRYKKKYLDKKKYRKEMKRIAKAERKELQEMKKLGYIKSNNPDDEISKLKLDSINQKMINALSDAYSQKHFVE